MAFTRGIVVDPDGPHRHDTTIVVRGGRIERVGPASELAAPEGAQVVDLRGRYVIPGLADMHQHSSFARIDLPLLVVNGVTRVREMSGTPELHEWRRCAEAGTLLGPRSTIASRIIDGRPTLWDPDLVEVVQVTGDRDARAAVREQLATGADFVKVYTRLPRRALRAVADEVRRHDAHYAGHCPDHVPIAEAVTLGQRSFEHLTWTMYGASRREAEIRARLDEFQLGEGDYNGWLNQTHPLELRAGRTFDADKAAALFDRLAGFGARQVPTLIMYRGLDNARTVDRDDPRRRYLPPGQLRALDTVLDEIYLKGRTPEQDADWAEVFEHRLRLVGAMHKAGVPIMAGTDGGCPAVFPGFGLHDELRLLTEAGLSTRAALRAATVEPAAFLGTRSGRIAPGYDADLVVLNGDPIADITNTTAIHGVMIRGRYIGPGEREAILREVEETAAGMREDG
ncbi:amidohydrolase family protein [Amycolatopsis suaedae]|uniref:Amidohydrolase-related domain-containing protein n=1 Tax=Amycolatopsis suaedae TaxID=2510978 RepID=A0A4Q7J0Y8_9PSEU|nr:amidohydrolase family protein [Amycolatopsis suaedae]RZQ60242.1 hypothetical protein EWH70_30110 [Amycolatopsis suaedae]